MNQMGHQGPNMVGADAAKLKQAIRPLIPSYMPMGTNGMGDMAEMQTSVGHMGKMQMTMGEMTDHSKQMTTREMSDHSKQMTMDDMGNHAMQMAMPENSIAMMGGKGPHGTIDMGGMFTVLKVRENLTSYADPGWYQPPPGTVAQAASKQDLERDGIKL